MAQISTIFGQWADKLQAKVDQENNALHHQHEQHDNRDDSEPLSVQKPSPESHVKEANWHSVSTETARRTRIFKAPNTRFINLLKNPHESVAVIALRKRSVSVLRRLRIWLLVHFANKLINNLTRLDDFLVRRFILPKGAGVLPKQLMASAKHSPSAQKLSRKTMFGALISENTEDLLGVVYPDGIPEKRLKLYTNPRLLVIKGDGFNQYGHALLAFGDPSSNTDRYVQISSANWYPEHMNGTQFSNYIHKWKGEIAYEVRLDCKDEQAMRKRLNELSSTKWLWGGPIHNCMTFCKYIGFAGKMEADFFSSTTFDKPFSKCHSTMRTYRTI